VHQNPVEQPEFARSIALFTQAGKVTPIWGNSQKLALAWRLKNPNVSTVLTGTSRAEQVCENMKALDLVPKLTAEIMDQIETILENKPEAEDDFC
jgi:aryl-alcohol dehydrogenase-like predicted oxidoreductase